MKKLTIIATFLYTTAIFAIEKPFDMTVGESFKNPIGYSLDDLSFSWKIPVAKDDKGEECFDIKQTAYQIVAAANEDALDEKPLWDTGKVDSDKSNKVRYTGTTLKSRDRLYWKVRYWNNAGETSDWSDVSFLEAGLLNNSDWKGKWISSAEPQKKYIRKVNEKESTILIDYVPCACFRKQFNAPKNIKSARLYVASRGVIECYINGKKVSNEFLGTDNTNYNNVIQTNAYDITKLMYKGDNTFASIIGDGWYSGGINPTNDKRGTYGERPELLAQIEITYTDNSTDIIASDETWKYTSSATIFSDINYGETYDARLETEGWNRNDFEDDTWETPNTKSVEAKPLLKPRTNQPIIAKDVLTPIAITKIDKGRYIFDIGQNMVGRVKIKVPSVKNRTYKIGYAEKLGKDGTPYKNTNSKIQSEDVYISAGGDYMDEWQPKFTYHSFRYVDISGISENIEPQLDWVQGIVVYNDIAQNGTFICDNPLINKLQSCIQWGQRNNFLSMPSDTTNAQIFCPTATFNMNVEAFFTKWIRDLADASKNNITQESDAIVLCTWEIYLAYGNEKILKDNYEIMKSWIDYAKRNSKDFIRTPKDSKSLMRTAYFVRCADIMEKVAKVLDKQDDVKYFENLARSVRTAFNRHFVSLDGTVKGENQTSYLLTLGFDIAPESIHKKVFENFIKTIEESNNQLNTDIVGASLMNPVLTKFGRTDLAYKLLNNTTNPSWLYAITQGATAMGNKWNNAPEKSDISSYNNYGYGAIGQWLYKDVAGIWYDENSAGYKNIIYAPKPANGINAASASHETPYGTASSSWRISDGVMEWNVVIPPNATGTLDFPTKKVKTIRVNGRRVSEKFLTISNGIPKLNLGSGTYKILLRPIGYK